MRQAPRVPTPPQCVVKIDSKIYPLRNWSTLGFLAGSYEGDLIVKQRIKLAIAVRQDHFNIAFDAEAVVVRIEGGEIAGRFIFLQPEKRREIEAYFVHYARGGP
ncbi:MAG: hypothetical protein HYR63_11530 [Proteobacteria bacterium]|nr:hypothetical protein [Pseudomonadota bacterium]